MLSNTKYERDFGSYFYEFCLSMKIVLGLPKDLKEKWGTKYRSLFFILGINLLIMVFIYGYYSINKDCPLFCLVFFVVLVFGHFVLFCMLCFFFSLFGLYFTRMLQYWCHYCWAVIIRWWIFAEVVYFKIEEMT